jgi:uncharacterized protein YxeA
MEENKEPMPDIYFPNNDKPNLKTVLIIIGILISTIVIIILTSIHKEKTPEPTEFIKKQVDSLAKANAELEAKHQALDSAAKTYQIQIYDLDWKLSNVGHDKTIIREYYHDKVKEPATYTPKQVDSFFKKRYNY